MKELTSLELVHINGGEVSTARRAGRAVGNFLGYCTAILIFVADAAADAAKAVF